LTLKTGRAVAHWSFVALALLLTLYIAVVSFGAVGESVRFFAVVVTAITIITTVLGIRDLIDARLQGPGGWWWVTKLCLAGVALFLALAGGGYEAVNMDALIVAAPYYGSTQIAMGALLLGAVVIAGWLHWGWVLPGVVVVGVIYFFFGEHVSAPLLQHPHYDASFVMNYLTLDPTSGVFMFLQVLTDELYFLILFGAILVGIGVVRLFMEVGNAVGTRVSGGAAFPAIIASGVLGAILAQAVASTTIIGRLTIPTMQKAGYSASMAGAIETLAATSGQLMPPILGLAAFIMAALLNIPYITIALASLVPALLYLVPLVFVVMSYSGKHRLGAMQGVRVDYHAIWRLLPSFVLPFGVVIWMLTRYISPALTGLVGIVVAFVVWSLNGKYRVSFRELLRGVETGLELVVVLAILILLIGPLAQTFQTTGLSNNSGLYLGLILPHSKFVLLVAAAVVSLLLGMGLPTPIAYLATVLTMGSFLIQVADVDPMLAHFFMFYFAVFSTITPPVAVGALAASKIANVSYWYIGGQSMKIALSMFILPFAFVYNPVLLEFPKLSWELLAVAVVVLLVQWCFACSQFEHMFRTLGRAERSVLFLIGALGFVTLLQPDWGIRVGFGLAAVAISAYFFASARSRRRSGTVPGAVGE
jgi:TRAP transporter 4TM/12TM fusion protein